MAFIFSTSHLPETRLRRPAHLEEDEEKYTPQPQPRAGGVRAFSHLPVRDNPAPSTGTLRDDSPRGEIAPRPPRSATPSTSRSPMSEAQGYAPPPEAPGWVRKLDALAAANKDKGGFTHLVILDHGTPADQHFGRFPGSYENETALTPESAAWRIIASVMAPDGHIHFGGCRVARHQHGRDYLNELLRSLGKDSQITIDAVTGPMFNQSNQFEGDLIQAQPLP